MKGLAKPSEGSQGFPGFLTDYAAAINSKLKNFGLYKTYSENEEFRAEIDSEIKKAYFEAIPSWKRQKGTALESVVWFRIDKCLSQIKKSFFLIETTATRYTCICGCAEMTETWAGNPQCVACETVMESKTPVSVVYIDDAPTLEGDNGASLHQVLSEASDSRSLDIQVPWRYSFAPEHTRANPLAGYTILASSLAGKVSARTASIVQVLSAGINQNGKTPVEIMLSSLGLKNKQALAAKVKAAYREIERAKLSAYGLDTDKGKFIIFSSSEDEAREEAGRFARVRDVEQVRDILRK